MLSRIAVFFVALFALACSESDRSHAAGGSGMNTSEGTKRVYRCDVDSLIEFDSENPLDALDTAEWRVVADGLCADPTVYDGLKDLVAGLPEFTEQDFPFVGYCEHYLLSQGGSRALLIGFVCEGHGIVVWEAHPDEEGRWFKSGENTLRGTEADKGAIRAILSQSKFFPL